MENINTAMRFEMPTTPKRPELYLKAFKAQLRSLPEKLMILVGEKKWMRKLTTRYNGVMREMNLIKYGDVFECLMLGKDKDTLRRARKKFSTIFPSRLIKVEDKGKGEGG